MPSVNPNPDPADSSSDSPSDSNDISVNDTDSQNTKDTLIAFAEDSGTDLAAAQEPPYPMNASYEFEIPGTGIGATCQVRFRQIDILWHNPQNGSYSLTLSHGNQTIYYGGHPAEYAPVSLVQSNLTPSDILKGSFTEYGSDNHWVRNWPEFSIDLSRINFPLLGATDNVITYTFSEDFPLEAKERYQNFIDKGFPIITEFMGPPAEPLNTNIVYMGHSSNYYEIVDNGRTFLTDATFYPRLIIHEFIHAWKGNFVITSDSSWEYDPALSGFEEGITEGLAFEIVHEYVNRFPNDPASLLLLENKPYQYWSAMTTYYDSIKNNRATGAGEFWTNNGGQRYRYSISATTVQMMIRKNPDFVKRFMAIYYQKIMDNVYWSPNRTDIIDMWQAIIPELNGYPLKEYLDTLPVFNGKQLDPAIYILTTIRPYGTSGDQQFAVSYSLPSDGMLWWGIKSDELDTIPSWIKTSLAEDEWYYIDTQDSPFTVAVADVCGYNQSMFSYKTKWDRASDGSPTGFGWIMPTDLNMENFPVALYKETVLFTDYIAYDAGAREDFYFFGLKDFTQDREHEYVIMVGVDGICQGTAKIVLDGEEYTEEIHDGLAIFRSTTWDFDRQGQFPITITNTENVSHVYYRTLILAGTVLEYYQHQFIIVDTNFNGIEDQFE